ncbi:hypothetical protein D3C81_1761360 [compost metagenome]
MLPPSAPLAESVPLTVVRSAPLMTMLPPLSVLTESAITWPPTLTTDSRASSAFFALMITVPSWATRVPALVTL